MAQKKKPGARGGRSKAAPAGSKRLWLWVPLGVALGAWALWGLMTMGTTSGPVSEQGAAPRGEIGDASRAQLREILRAADEEDETAGAGAR